MNIYSIILASSLGSGFSGALGNIRSMALGTDGTMGAVRAAGVSLAALCVGISLLKIARDYVDGTGSMTPWTLFRPIGIFLLVCSFQTLVMGPIDYFCGVYTGRLASANTGSMKEFNETFKNAVEKAHKQKNARFQAKLNEIQNSDKGWLWKIWQKFMAQEAKEIRAPLEALQDSLWAGISYILVLLMRAYSSLLVILADIMMVIMAIIGPYTFALAILPGFHGGIKLWVERYIQYSFYAPLTNLICHINNLFLCSTLESTDNITWEAQGQFFGMIMIIFVSVKCLSQVPAIASFMVESASTEGMANHFTQRFSKITKIL